VLAKENVDVFLITHTADIRWLTNFAGVFDSEQAHAALVLCTKKQGDTRPETCPPDTLGNGLFLHSDSRYSEALRALNVASGSAWRISDERVGHSTFVAQTLQAHFTGDDRSNPVRIGIESDLRLDLYRALEKALAKECSFAWELVELPQLVMELRARKDADEIERLRAAQALCDQTFKHMLTVLAPGMTEKEAALELDFFMRRAGADDVAFPTIVASGPNSARPHAVPGERVLQKGDFVLMDFGVQLADYRSDMTRTVVLGSASKRQRSIYEAVLAAQLAAKELIAPGITAKEAHQAADACIEAAGFGGHFTHGLGHGVGIDIHELPVLGPKVETKLEPGHVFTLEPGIYIEGEGGVRIEDFGVVTADGFETFTQSPHELVEL
jgi:Xaa-Pro aminopeptidase